MTFLFFSSSLTVCPVLSSCSRLPPNLPLSQLEGFEARITDYLEFSHPIALWDSALQNLAKASRYLVGTNKKFIFYMQSLRSSLQM